MTGKYVADIRDVLTMKTMCWLFDSRDFGFCFEHTGNIVFRI
jgi:hypothetical protein